MSKEFTCKICNKEFNNYKGLQTHSNLTHKIPSATFYVNFFLDGVRPTCKCGCGEETKWLGWQSGFRDYRRGHIARIHNNWGHNQKAIDNSAISRRKQHALGNIIPWNKGKSWDETFSKEMQARLLIASRAPAKRAKLSKALKGRIFTEEHRRKISASLTERWKCPILRNEQRIRRLEQMHHRDHVTSSKLEIKFASFLKELDIEYEQQFLVRDINAFYDFKIKDKNILIETDGDFWHCNPSTKFAIPKYDMQKNNLKKDIIKNKWAVDNNYQIIRFWEADVNNNKDVVMEKLSKLI